MPKGKTHDTQGYLTPDEENVDAVPPDGDRDSQTRDYSDQPDDETSRQGFVCHWMKPSLTTCPPSVTVRDADFPAARRAAAKR